VGQEREFVIGHDAVGRGNSIDDVRVAATGRNLAGCACQFAILLKELSGIGVFDARRAATFLTAPATTTNAAGFGIRRLPRARWVSPE